ncbi:MAG: energy transducer TonB [Acidobacteria bacterium]|nr:MAG: energy transducer TonB [Acidobacteriota bacterium]
MGHAQHSILPFLILALAAPLSATDRHAISSLLDKAYKDQNLVLRTSNSGATIRYSQDGRLIKGGEPGPWTLDADIHCARVELKRKDLAIKGKRLYFLYDKKLEVLRPYLGPDVNVEIALDSDSPSLSALQQAIANVFVTGSENARLLVPHYWKDYLLHPNVHATVSPRQEMSAVPPGSIQKLTGESKEQASPVSSRHNIEFSADPGKNGNVTPPRPTYKPEPSYTPEARMARIEGTVVFSVVIDASGRVTDESILRPVGLGLDDNAAQTLQTWKFQPATVDGKPVAARVGVEVSFQLR